MSTPQYLSHLCHPCPPAPDLAKVPTQYKCLAGQLSTGVSSNKLFADTSLPLRVCFYGTQAKTSGTYTHIPTHTHMLLHRGSYNTFHMV